MLFHKRGQIGYNIFCHEKRPLSVGKSAGAFLNVHENEHFMLDYTMNKLSSVDLYSDFSEGFELCRCAQRTLATQRDDGYITSGGEILKSLLDIAIERMDEIISFFPGNEYGPEDDCWKTARLMEAIGLIVHLLDGGGNGEEGVGIAAQLGIASEKITGFIEVYRQDLFAAEGVA